MGGRHRELPRTALGAEEHPLSPFLCCGAVAGVTSTPDFSVKYLYLVSLAPHKGGCLWLPNFSGKGENKEGKRSLFLWLFFKYLFLFFNLKINLATLQISLRKAAHLLDDRSHCFSPLLRVLTTKKQRTSRAF